MSQSTLSFCAVRKVCCHATYQASWTPSSLSLTDGTHPPRQVRTHNTRAHTTNASIISADVSASISFPVLSCPILSCPALFYPIAPCFGLSFSIAVISSHTDVIRSTHAHTHTHTHMHTHSQFSMHLLTTESQCFPSFNFLIPTINNTIRRLHVWS